MTATPSVPLWTVAREWGRIGVIGFGGPPAHVALLRDLCVTRRAWLTPEEFEEGIAATNLLPGPASTQLAILCAWRLAGAAGAIVGGLAFICPGLVIILALAAVFLASHPPTAVLGAASGADAAVPAVALVAALSLVPSSWARAGTAGGARARWVAYVAAGAAGVAVLGPLLVAALVACGAVEVASRHHRTQVRRVALAPLALRAPLVLAGGLGAVAWVALKVGALSFGGGFVIVPLMQHDAVTTYHWMTQAQFLDAVALGQVTPGPVVQTVAVVGYAASGLRGALLAASVAFAPSFAFVLLLGPRLRRLRESDVAQGFLAGAGAAAIGAIGGASVPLGLSLSQWWQVPVLVGAAAWLLVRRTSTVPCLIAAASLGALVALGGAPIAR